MQDDFVPFISAFTVGGVIVVFGILNRGRKPDAEERSGTFELSYPGGVRGLAIAFALVPFGIGALGYFSPHRTEPLNPWDLLKMALIFWILSAPLLIEAFRKTVVLSDDAITSRSPWTGEIVMPWSSIQRIVYDSSMMWFVVTDRAGRKLRLSYFLSGLATFEKQASQRAPAGATASFQ